MGNKTRHTANLVSDNNLFVDIANDRVGIGSTQPTAKLNVAGIVSATSFIGDGSQLSGVTVTGNASLQQLSVSGNITANGNIVGDNSTNITGISGVTASTLTGTLQTAAQTNITSVGTLGSLTVSGNITANGNIVGDNATNISGVNQVTATTFSGSGASLTGLTGASAATYGGASVSPQITVDANGRITGITNVSIAGGGGGGGSSIIVQDSQSLVGAAGTIDFGTGLSVSTISAGVATVTAAGITTHDVSTNTLNVVGVSTLGSLKVDGDTIRSTGQINLITNGSSFDLDINTTDAISAGGQGASQYVRLYGSGSEKLETVGSGVTVTGTTFSNQLSVSGISTFQSHVELGDSDELRLGAGNDLKIYHNGTNSHIENGTGQLLIRAKTSENSINCIPDGQVELYHNNLKKFETTINGVSISGNIDTVTDISCNSIANNAGGGATWTLNNTGNATFTGTVTANTFSGSGANLTNLPAANLTGTLPAISGANLTNLPAPTPADTDVQVTFDVSSNGSSAYRFTGPGYSGADDNPDIYLVRGQRYRFINGTGSGHPFRIQSDTSGTAYTDGVSGSQSGTQDFNVQHDAPTRLYYQCTVHSGMIGNIYIVGGSDWRMTDVATNATPEIFTNLNVGIGTDNPYHELHIQGSGDTRALITSGGTGDAAMMFENASGNTWGHGIDLTNNNYVIAYNGTSDPSLTTDGIFQVTGIGSVGVGLANPDSRFHVQSTSNHVATFEYSSTSDMAIQLKNSQGSMYFGLDGGERFAIATDPDLNGTGNSKFTVDSSGRVRMPDQPAALVYKTGTNQNYTADAIVNYDATSYSQGGMTINSNRNRITVPVAGKYMIYACASGSCTTASAGDGWQLKILRDGSTYNDGDGYPIETTGSEAGQELAYTLSMVVDAAANDYFEIEIGNVGSARATISRGYFGIYLLG